MIERIMDFFGERWAKVSKPMQWLIIVLCSMLWGEIFLSDDAHETIKALALTIPKGWRTIVRPLLGTTVAFVIVLLGKTILEQHVRFKALAIRDSLTGLYNRRFLEENLKPIFSKAARHEEFAFLCFIDMNNFKYINDTYGHHVGDLALRAVAEKLLATIRSADIVARYGGDEFVIFWTSSDLSKSEAFLERVQSAFSRITFSCDNREIVISGTVGFKCEPADDEDALKEIFKKADTAMLQKKKSR